MLTPLEKELLAELKGEHSEARESCASDCDGCARITALIARAEAEAEVIPAERPSDAPELASDAEVAEVLHHNEGGIPVGPAGVC